MPLFSPAVNCSQSKEFIIVNGRTTSDNNGMIGIYKPGYLPVNLIIKTKGVYAFQVNDEYTYRLHNGEWSNLNVLTNKTVDYTAILIKK